MKTIFLTISRGFLARNILQTDVYRDLLKSGYRIVIATPAFEDPEFLAEFGHEYVAFVPLHLASWTWLDRILVGLHRNLIWNRTTQFTATYGIYDASKVPPWRAWMQYWFWRPLAQLAFLRTFSRFLDGWLRPPSAKLIAQLRECRPDVVFSTNPMEDTDSFYLKAARELKIPTIGLVKSWDNMSKTSFRILTDAVLVWGPYMTEEARTCQQYRPDQIAEVGVPQFDAYQQRMSPEARATFLASFGLDPARKTILFGSEGKVTPDDPSVVALIADMIRRQDLPCEAQILVRPHFGYKRDDEKFASNEGVAHVAVDHFNHPRLAFYDQWDYSAEHFQRLVDTLHVCDVMVTTASTLAIDAAAVGIPTIVIAFDGTRKLPHRQSVARWYETEYYSNVLATGAVTVVHDLAELRAALQAALTHPERRLSEREALLKRFAGPLDGHAGARVAACVASMAETGHLPKTYV